MDGCTGPARRGSLIPVSTPTTTWTEADIAALEKVAASGLLTVSYGGPPARSETFQSLDAIRKQIAIMKIAVRGAPPTHRFAAFNKGFRRRRYGARHV